MYRACIALIDATRARFFTYERLAGGEGTHDELVERTDLVNPVRHQRASEQFSAPAGSGHIGGVSYGLDDHRDQHTAQIDLAFARTAVATLRDLVDEYPSQRLIVCAGPRMLGNLRACLLPDDIALDELPHDLVKLSPSAIRAQLADHGLLPPVAAEWQRKDRASARERRNSFDVHNRLGWTSGAGTSSAIRRA